MTLRQAARGPLACIGILVLTLGLRTALLPWMPIPAPIIHDEFSYLLAADTYAHGRLANPMHPFWEHFESFQIMQQPVYMSKYQPLQGMVLAVGQKLFNQPWVGVLLSTGLLCAALCWMLQGWISPRWALAAAGLFALRVGVLSYWMNSYEGGSVPGIGGALALGALPRIARDRKWKHSLTWAFGLSIVALSRPYDAAVLGIASGAVLLWWMSKLYWIPKGRPRENGFVSYFPRAAVLPALAAFAALAIILAYNNFRVTGSVLTLPYALHDGQYSVTSMFAVLPLKAEPLYRHLVMHDFWANWNVGQWRDARAEPFTQSLVKLATMSDFFFGFWPLTLLLLAWPSPLATLESRLTLALLAAFVLMLLPLIAVVPHYGSAFAGVLYLRYTQSWSRLAAWRPGGKALGRALAACIAILYIGAFSHSAYGLVRNGASSAALSDQDSFSHRLAERVVEFGDVREAMNRRLAALPGKQLVLVRYSADHNLQNEWVYNAAQIDPSPVVWAREMGPAQDAPFLRYFHDRQAWLLEADQTPPRLSPYCEPPSK